MQLYTTMHDFVLTLRQRAVPGLKALCLGCEEEQAALPRIEKHMKIEDVYYIHLSMVRLLLSIYSMQNFMDRHGPSTFSAPHQSGNISHSSEELAEGKGAALADPLDSLNGLLLSALRCSRYKHWSQSHCALLCQR